MIWNYLKIAWRNLRKDKTYTGLNIFGLSVAFGAAILLCIFALFQLSFDRFHENADRIYMAYATEQTKNGPNVSTSKPEPFAKTLQEEVPGIEKITRYNGGPVLVGQDEKQFNLQSAFVDPEFFSIFSFPVKDGNPMPVNETSEVALTEKTAKKLFGQKEALNQTVYVLIDGKEEPFTVTSILEDIPEESSLDFDIALNFKSQSDFAYGRNEGNWSHSNHEVYLQLAEGISPDQYEASTRNFTSKYFTEFIEGAKRDGVQPDANGTYLQERLISLKDIHFASPNGGLAEANRTYAYLVLAVAFMILFIASVNFINMNIAKSSQRLGEIGVRKTMGAKKTQLFFQFWGESLLIFIAALLLGFLIAKGLLKPFQTLFNTEASFANVINPVTVIGSLIALLIITFIAGGYPAYLVSKLGTINALKGKMDLSGKNRIRNILIVVQFGLAILLISCTFVLQDQIRFLRSKDLGFNKEQVLSFPLNGKKEPHRAMELLRNNLRDTPGIVSVSAANNNLGMGKDGSRYTSVITFDHKEEGQRTNIVMVDYDFTETVGVEMMEGRAFSREFGNDSLTVLINEAMAESLKEENVVGTKLQIEDSTAYSVIGVVKNFNFQSLDKEVEPLTLFLKPQWNLRYAYVKVAPSHLLEAYDQVKLAWSKVEPQAEFMGSFLNENIDRTLRRERTMATLITSGSILAIILSCTGLFAMSLLVVSQRRKEIGIRKVVGASVSNITYMLTLDFLKLVAVAFIIAGPLAWWLTGKWIENYPYRIELNVWLFIAAGGIAGFIALLTVSYHALRAATSNPVKSLKTE